MNDSVTELNDEQYDIFRETEAKLTKGKIRTTKVKRKKKYVSPYRREAPEPTEVVCAECKLPSTKGLPPFIAVNRLVDGEIRKTLRHYACPQDADGILALITQRGKDAKKRMKDFLAPSKGKVVSLSYVDGEEIRRTVVA